MTSLSTAPVDRQTDEREPERIGSPAGRAPHPLRATAVVLLISVIAGALTPLGQLLLPASISSLANSCGSWTVVVFLAVYASRARGAQAGILGAVAFLVMNLSFAVAFLAHGYAYSSAYLTMWILIGLVIGPMVGLAASWLRSDRPSLVAAGVAAPSAVLIGEGAYLLLADPGQSPIYAVSSVVAGCAYAVAMTAIRLQDATSRQLAAALTLGGAVSFIAAYSALQLSGVILRNLIY